MVNIDHCGFDRRDVLKPDGGGRQTATSKAAKKGALNPETKLNVSLGDSSDDERLLAMPQDGAEGWVYFQVAVVANESLRLESIHEQTGPGASGADHFRENLLTYPGKSSRSMVFRVQISQPQERASKPLFT